MTQKALIKNTSGLTVILEVIYDGDLNYKDINTGLKYKFDELTMLTDRNGNLTLPGGFNIVTGRIENNRVKNPSTSVEYNSNFKEVFKRWKT